jgi:hypothetical protein
LQISRGLHLMCDCSSNLVCVAFVWYGSRLQIVVSHRLPLLLHCCYCNFSLP